MTSVYAHIVTYNSSQHIVSAIQSLLSQAGFTPNRNLFIGVTDNNSSDTTVLLAKKLLSDQGIVYENSANLGFAGAHNQGAQRFLESAANYFLIINPDLILGPEAIRKFVDAAERLPSYGCFGGKLLRVSEVGALPTIDSTGIVFTKSLRHFDRGAEELDRGQYDKEEDVAGVTGACAFYTRGFVTDVAFTAAADEDKCKIYPQLSDISSPRIQLFDEAFFMYREDADLAWRASILGWKTRYLPTVKAEHVRRVTPERRGELPAEINLCGVRNRFLLQLNNFSFTRDWKAVLPGLVGRNIIVIVATLLKERSSLVAFPQIKTLWNRGQARRRILQIKSRDRNSYGMF